MYKVIKIIYTVKTMEYLEAMEKRSKKIPQASIQFAPMLHWVVNFFNCCLVIGLIIFALTSLEAKCQKWVLNLRWVLATGYHMFC